jgi:hypothetical protein
MEPALPPPPGAAPQLVAEPQTHAAIFLVLTVHAGDAQLQAVRRLCPPLSQGQTQNDPIYFRTSPLLSARSGFATTSGFRLSPRTAASRGPFRNRSGRNDDFGGCQVARPSLNAEFPCSMGNNREKTPIRAGPASKYHSLSITYQPNSLIEKQGNNPPGTGN